MELIEHKIFPPQEKPAFSRKRLLDALESSLETHTVTVLAGRAGTGKTVLSLDFARHCYRNVAWLKVDATDSEIWTFLRYLSGCVARIYPRFGRHRWSYALQGEFNPSILAELYVYEVQRLREPLLLVLDNLHHVYDSDWFVPFFSRLISLLPSDVHLLILARSLPPAPLWRTRSKQKLCVIDEQALAFTLSEAEELFESLGLDVEGARKAHSHSRGVAAVLNAEAEAAVKERKARSRGKGKGFASRSK